MKPRTFLPLLGAGALLIATGVAVQVASADEKPLLTSEYAEAGFWTGGLIGTYTVKNPTATAATDWKQTFGRTDGAQLAGVWNGTLSSAKGGVYTITPTAQTKTLAGKGSLAIGITALANSHATPIKCEFNGKA